MKYFLILVTGGPYFLTPCVIIRADTEEGAVNALRESNRAAYTRYRIVVERVKPEDLNGLEALNVFVATSPEDIADAF